MIVASLLDRGDPDALAVELEAGVDRRALAGTRKTSRNPSPRWNATARSTSALNRIMCGWKNIFTSFTEPGLIVVLPPGP